MDTMRLRLSAAVFFAALLFSVPPAAHAAGHYPALTVPPLAAGLGEPSDFAVALNGEMFVADSANGRVAVVVGGQVVRDWDGSGGAGPELRRPTGISLGPDDLLYVADSQADTIVVYERDGDFVRVIGSSGTASGQLRGPSDVIADATGIWVADTFNDRVQRFSLAGVWVKTIGGGATGMFGQPVSLDLYNGLVYVSESTGQRGQAFNATTGAVGIAPWGITDSGGGLYVSRYLRPAGIDVDSSGRLLLVDGGRSVVEQLNAAASVVTTLSLGGSAGDLWQPTGVVSSGDTVFVADTLHDRIARYSFSSAAWVGPIEPTGSSAPGAFMAPTGAVSLPGGGFVVADTGNDRIARFDASGAFIGEFAGSGAAAVDGPTGVVVSAGEVFVADTGNNRIQVYDTSGAHLRTIAGPGTGNGQLMSPTGLAVDASGNLLVADTGNNRVQRLTAAGGHLQTFGGLSAPRGVAADAAGVVYVADTGSHRIRSFLAAGNPSTAWGTFGSGAGQLAAPEGVAVDPVSGEIVVADTGNHRLQVFTAAGVPVSVMSGRGTAADELRSPRSVSVDASRGMLIADSGNHRVRRLGYDDVVPVTSADGVGPTWVNHPVTVTLTAGDAGSGVATTYYRIGTGADTTYTVPFTVSAQGTTNVRYWSVDRAGNTELAKVGQVRIDSLPPSGTMSLAGGASIVGTRTVSVDSSVADAFTMAIDTGSGFGPRIDYAPSMNVALPGDGVRTVTVRYYDFLDNVLTLSDSVTVDQTGPSVSLSRTPASAVTSLPVDVTLTATDALSGVAQRFARVDAAAEQPYATPVRVDTEGAHTVVGRAVDGVGNSGTSSTSFVIDRTGPVVAMSGIEDGDVFGTAALFELAASDALSAPGPISYRIDGGVEQLYAGEVTVASEGAHSVRFSAVDAVGNTGAAEVVDFTVDLTPPTVSTSGVVQGSFRATDTTVTLDAADALSGIDYVRYRVDGGEWMPYESPFAVSGEGPHIVDYEAGDRAGHVSAPGTISFTIDSRVPVGSLVANEGAPFSAHADILLTSAVSGAELMRFDSGSGFGPWLPYATEYAVTLPGEGAYTIVGEYMSVAGLSTQIPVALTVDMTAPVVMGARFVPRAIAGSGVSFMTRLTGTWEAFDAGVAPSGIARHTASLGGIDYVPSSPSQQFSRLGVGVYTLHASAVDAAGNVSVGADTELSLGAFQAPTVVSGSGRGVARLSATAIAAQGESVVFRCFRQDDAGDWMLAYTVRARRLQTATGPVYRATTRLKSGTWRVAVESAGANTYRLGTPSAAFTVR